MLMRYYRPITYYRPVVPWLRVPSVLHQVPIIVFSQRPNANAYKITSSLRRGFSNLIFLRSTTASHGQDALVCCFVFSIERRNIYLYIYTPFFKWINKVFFTPRINFTDTNALPQNNRQNVMASAASPSIPVHLVYMFFWYVLKFNNVFFFIFF